VYGKNPALPWVEDTTELQPISPYASSKIAGEALGRVYSHLYNMEFVALRFFTVYGPRQRPDLAIHKFFNKIYNNDVIELYGNGETYRDYTYVDDTINGIINAIYTENVNEGFNCFNLGNRYEVSLAFLVEEIQRITKIKANIRYLPEQPGDVRRTCADIEKSKARLQYEPVISISEGLSRFNEWFKKENKSQNN
jgi:UDP-glucuronate 4-epimerase